MGKPSAETADISTGTKTSSAAHNLARLLYPGNPRIWQPLQKNPRTSANRWSVQFPSVPAKGDKSKQPTINPCCNT